MLTVVPDPADRDSSGSSSLIDEIVREGARRVLAEDLQAEVDSYILVAFCACPADWIHVRTTNPVESALATVRHRSKIAKGPGSRAAGLAMAFKLIQAARDRWRAVGAPHLAALARDGATFINGQLARRPGHRTAAEPRAGAAA